MEGDCQAVWVWEARPGGPPSWWREVWEAADVSGEINGYHVCSFNPTDWGPREEWFAIVDDRFLVRATRKALLEAALRRTGSTIEERLKRWQLPMGVARHEQLFMVRVSDTQPSGWPNGLQGFVMRGPVGAKFEMSAQAGDLESLQAWLRNMGFRSIVKQLCVADGLRLEVDIGESLNSVGAEIAFHFLFGFCVFI